MGNSSYHSLDTLSIKDMFTRIPNLDMEKFIKLLLTIRFEKAKEDIIEYTKERLKKLLELHQIKMNDLSWHSRSAEMLLVYEGHTDHGIL
jgi:hypothetical protein